MPTTYSFSDHSIWVKLIGEVLPEEFSSAINQAIADERFIPGMYLVFDFQEYTRTPSTGDLKARAKFLKALRKKISSTIVEVIANSNLHYGLAVVFQIFSKQNGFQVEIFRHQDQAMEWLQAQRVRSVSPAELLDACL